MKESKIEQKRTQKRTEGTAKNSFFSNSRVKKNRKKERKKKVCTINKICAGENTSRYTSEKLQELQDMTKNVYENLAWLTQMTEDPKM